MSKLHWDDATVSTTKSSSTSRIRPAASSDLRYERALLSAYGLESCMSLEELKSYVTTNHPVVASSSQTTNNSNNNNNNIEGDSDLFRFLCAALNSSISNQKKQQQEEQKKLRDSNNSSHTDNLDLQNSYSIVVLEMQIAQLNFDVAELRTREEEQILLHDNLKKCTNRLQRDKEHVVDRTQRLQETVESMAKAREESTAPMEQLVAQHAECEARALHLQIEYDQIQLGTSKTFQDYKERQSYEVELAEQVQELRSISKQHAMEKASIQLALDEVTQELDTLQMKVNDINREKQKAIHSKNDLEQQKEQLSMQIENQRKENEYMVQKIEEIKNGTCRGRAAASFEAAMSDCPTPWSQKRSSIRNKELVVLECNPNLESTTNNNKKKKNKGRNNNNTKKPIHFTIQIGDHIKKEDKHSGDEDSCNSSSSMSSVTIGTKRSLISTIFHPHVHFPFVHHSHHHMKTKKDTGQLKGIKKKISEEEVHSSEEEDEDDKDLSDPLTYWKYRQES